MSDGPPKSNGELEASCRHFEHRQRINEAQESAARTFISDYYYQNSIQHEPGWIVWADVLLVVAHIMVGLMG
jgi:hypothetical protein